MSETMNFSEMIAEVPGIGQYVQAQTPHLLETRNLKAGYLGREVDRCEHHSETRRSRRTVGAQWCW